MPNTNIEPFLQRLRAVDLEREDILEGLRKAYIGKTCLCSHLPPYFKRRRVTITNVVFRGGIVFIVRIDCDPNLDGNGEMRIKQGQFYRSPQQMAGFKRIKIEHVYMDSIK